MMVVIRLSRGGSKKRPYFNVVVAESSKKRDGRFIERVGFYNPSAREGSETLRLESERIEYWQSNGAQLSETVNRIVKLNAKGPDGLVAMKKKDEAKVQARKNKKAADKAAKVEEAVSVEEEAPKEEAPKEEAAAPKEEAPKEEAPKEEAAAPKEEAPKEEAPKEEAAAPKEEAPKEEAPKEEAPKEEAAAPKEEAPKETDDK
ncbi:30S ribosomal protein S16 [Methylophilales bacterium]|nr:30S ribosomal protein S16 [Methylophilales bacterium]